MDPTSESLEIYDHDCKNLPIVPIFKNSLILAVVYFINLKGF